MQFELIFDFKGQENTDSSLNSFINRIIMYMQIHSTGRSGYCKCVSCLGGNNDRACCYSGGK
jgi:hypothetical protein